MYMIECFDQLCYVVNLTLIWMRWAHLNLGKKKKLGFYFHQAQLSKLIEGERLSLKNFVGQNKKASRLPDSIDSPNFGL